MTSEKQLPLSKGWLMAGSKSSTEKLRGFCANNESAIAKHLVSACDILLLSPLPSSPCIKEKDCPHEKGTQCNS